jgi:hypothetical protein
MIARDDGRKPSSALRHEYAWSIAIVGTEGIDDFLRTDLEAWLE